MYFLRDAARQSRNQNLQHSAAEPQPNLQHRGKEEAEDSRTKIKKIESSRAKARPNHEKKREDVTETVKKNLPAARRISGIVVQRKRGRRGKGIRKAKAKAKAKTKPTARGRQEANATGHKATGHRRVIGELKGPVA